MQTLVTLRYDKNSLYTVNRSWITRNLPRLIMSEEKKGMLFVLLFDELPKTEPLRLPSQGEGKKGPSDLYF